MLAHPLALRSAPRAPQSGESGLSGKENTDWAAIAVELFLEKRFLQLTAAQYCDTECLD
jgi:hypothetical protein